MFIQVSKAYISNLYVIIFLPEILPGFHFIFRIFNKALMMRFVSMHPSVIQQKVEIETYKRIFFIHHFYYQFQNTKDLATLKLLIRRIPNTIETIIIY